MQTIVYRVGSNLYINLTNRCTNGCCFCLRKNEGGYRDYDLWLEKEPTVDEVIEAVGDPMCYDQIVFCGYGEPMIRLNELIDICKALKPKGAYIRVNTNGHANLIHKRNVVPQLAGLVDSISISLNAPTAVRYAELCSPHFGQQAFEAVLEFAKECKEYIPHVVLTAVDILSPSEIEQCRLIAQELGVEFRLREYEG